MPDVEFEFNAVPGRYVDLVQRYAVLYSLKRPPTHADHVYAMTEGMVRMWRARVGALSNAGWVPNPSSDHGILYARNCRPTFAITSPPTRPCHLRQLCPFCYARWVRDMWLDIDAQFPMGKRHDPEEEAPENLRSILIDDEPQHSNDFRFHLVERHHYVYSDALIGGETHPDDVTHRLSDLLQLVMGARKKAIQLVQPIGALSFTTVEPGRKTDRWKFHHRQLFKIPANQELPEGWADRTHGPIYRHERPTRKVVLQSVARALRYPADIIRGDVDRTVQILQAKLDAKYRGYSRYRSFRTKRSEQISEV